MARKAPGKAHRKGLTLLEIADMFRDEDESRKWIEQERWQGSPHCPECGSLNVQCGAAHPRMTHRCRDCPGKPFFSVCKGSVMEGSNLPYRVWAVAIYLFTTNIKGISSMKLHRELGISQKSAWFLLHRLRHAAEMGTGLFEGPVEADEAYMGGKRSNMSNRRRRALRDDKQYGGKTTKTAVAGIKDRATRHVRAKVVRRTDLVTLQGFVKENTAPGASVYTDEAPMYKGLPFDHDSVKHSVSEYVRGQVHTNGMESFWSLLKRGYVGIYHKMSPKHLDRYVQEFAGRQNQRDHDTIDQMGALVVGMGNKRLTYDQLTQDNGLSSGARGDLHPALPPDGRRRSGRA